MCDPAVRAAPAASEDRLLQPPQLPLACRVRLADAHPERCPVLLLIHGAGGDENALLSLASGVSRGFNLVLPRAPRRLPRGGRFWYPVRFTPQGPQARPAQVDAACAQLMALLRHLREALGFRPPRLYLAGFSQGGALAVLMALRQPPALAGLGLLAARVLPQALETGGRDGPRLAGLPVFVAHGTRDPVLPLHQAALTMRWLLREGARPTLRLYAAPHAPTAAMAADFAAWLAPCAGPLPPADTVSRPGSAGGAVMPNGPNKGGISRGA